MLITCERLRCCADASLEITDKGNALDVYRALGTLIIDYITKYNFKPLT